MFIIQSIKTHYNIAQQLLSKFTLFNIGEIFKSSNQFLEFFRFIADISHLLEVIALFATKKLYLDMN